MRTDQVKEIGKSDRQTKIERLIIDRWQYSRRHDVRTGKKPIQLWLLEDVLDDLKKIASEKNITVQHLIETMVCYCLKQRGLSEKGKS